LYHFLLFENKPNVVICLEGSKTWILLSIRKPHILFFRNKHRAWLKIHTTGSVLLACRQLLQYTHIYT